VKDPTAEDKAVEKLVAGKLREQASTPSTACPDASILAAYFERTLAPKERAEWQLHFDACKKCQAHIAALARMDEADEAIPAFAPRPSGRATGRFFGLRWAWAAPLLLAVVVAGLWSTGELQPLLHPNGLQSPRVSAPVPPAQAAVGARSEAPSSAAKKSQAASRSIPPAGGELKAARQGGPNAASAKTPGRALPQAASVEGLATAKSEMAGRVPAPQSAETTHAPSPLPPLTAHEMAPLSIRGRNAPAPEAAPESGRAGNAVAGGLASAAAEKREMSAGGKSLTVEAAPSDFSQSQPTKTLGALSAQRDRLQEQELAASQVERKARQGAGFHYAESPSHTAAQGMVPSAGRWRVGPYGLIQKQVEGGRWITIPSGVTVDLLDISFAGSRAGWAVGRRGVVLRSTNGGESWSQAASPASGDLIRVTAVSSESAVVGTRDGRVYDTTDGGATWRAIVGGQ
jgi:Photosynthesis system II assembly factor YCF48